LYRFFKADCEENSDRIALLKDRLYASEHSTYASVLSQDNALQVAFILDTCLNNTKPDGFYNGSTKDKHNHYLNFDGKKIRKKDLTYFLSHIEEHGHTEGMIFIFFNKYLKEYLPKINKSPDDYSVYNKNILKDAGKFIGKLDKTNIYCFETGWFPDNYFMIVHASKEEKPLVFIQKKNPDDSGLLFHSGRKKDIPILNSYFFRWIEIFVALKGAGVVVHLSKKWKTPTVIEHIIEK